ncbi:MAG: hypothetical protein HZA23_00015 [Nitrospirae bacterium]|jgi:hypothetical protein|nr:hypothetical protein [Nitrospirota bacterium]
MSGQQGKGEEERVPMWQLFYDNIFLLLALGVAIPVVFYTLWGVMELVNLPVWPK